MPRFVILEHDHPVLHWDLLLEAGDVLHTWRLVAPPGAEPIEATALGDHRRMYLDYEGPVSGQRGTVRRHDAGTFSEEIPPTPSFERRGEPANAARLLHFEGTRITGWWRLEQIDGTRWRFGPAAPPQGR